MDRTKCSGSLQPTSSTSVRSKDLIASGVASDAEATALAEDDVSTMERQLLDEVERFSRPAVRPGIAADVAEAGKTSATNSTGASARGRRQGQPPAGELEALKRQLAEERAEKETAIREAARLAAALSATEENLSKEQERAAALDRAATKRAQRSPAPAGIGSRPDVSAGAIALAESTLAEIEQAPPKLRSAALTAVDLARRDPGSAIIKCRVILEALVIDEWRRVFKAKEPPKWKTFNDLARELDGQPGVDPAILNAERTLYRLSNPGAHTIDGVSPRRAALVLLLTANILAGRL